MHRHNFQLKVVTIFRISILLGKNIIRKICSGQVLEFNICIPSIYNQTFHDSAFLYLCYMDMSVVFL